MFFNVFDDANACASMHLLVEIHNKWIIFCQPKANVFLQAGKLVTLDIFCGKHISRCGKGSTQNVFAQRYYFCAKRVSKIVVLPKEMLFSFSTVHFLTNYDVTNRKHKMHLIYSIVQKRKIWARIKSMETTRAKLDLRLTTIIVHYHSQTLVVAQVIKYLTWRYWVSSLCDISAHFSRSPPKPVINCSARSSFRLKLEKKSLFYFQPKIINSSSIYRRFSCRCRVSLS